MKKKNIFVSCAALSLLLSSLIACNGEKEEPKSSSAPASSQVAPSSSSSAAPSSSSEAPASSSSSAAAADADATGHIWGADVDVAGDEAAGTVAYKKATCTENDGYVKFTVNQSVVTYDSGSSRKSSTPDGYTKLNGNNQTMRFKINLDKAYTGKLYLYGCMDGWSSNSNKKAFSYNGNPNIEVKVNDVALDIAALSDVVYTDFLSGDGSDLSDDGYGCLGDITLVQGVNEISYTRLASMNTLVKDFVLVVK